MPLRARRAPPALTGSHGSTARNAGGTWTLDLRDDTAGTNGGTLTAWSLRICEPPPPPACAPGFSMHTVFSTDFEGGVSGFTHSGAQDEWELGLPATLATTTAHPVAAFNTCNSGVNCWKTDLDNSYNASSNQDLISPTIDLTGLSAPVVVTWAQRHQVESANFDHMFVDYQQAGGATPVRLYEWLEPTPISAQAGTGNPQVNIGGSAGWGVFSSRADNLAGLNTELRFHLDTDTTVQFAGLAIDDVSVTACRALSSDLAITKTDGVTTAVPGSSVTYTITASNTGPDIVAAATITDTFPASLTATWTCVGAGGGTCTGAGTGNINDTVSLPAGASVTYTVTANIAAFANGTLSNTATITSVSTDPNPANNSATDTDTLASSSDLSITKTDGVTTATAGGATTYTITASNAGPSSASPVSVVDTLPSACTGFTYTSVATGGAIGNTVSGIGGINDLALDLPPGSSVTYSATCNINAAFSGAMSNTATVSGAAQDPNPGNNSATDVTTVTAQPPTNPPPTTPPISTPPTAGGPITATTARCKGVLATIVGTKASDRLNGTPGRDIIVGLGGNDVIDAGAGNDLVCAGPGNDIVKGGGGRDRLYGESGNDLLDGGSGNDLLNAGSGKEDICLFDGNDNSRNGCDRFFPSLSK